MYNEKIMNEFYNAERYDVIKGASGVGKITSDIGSEIIKIYIKVENEKIVEAKFQTYGGVVAVAASSVAVRLLEGMSINQAKRFNSNLLLEVLGEVPEHKMYVLTLVVQAVLTAIESYLSK